MLQFSKVNIQVLEIKLIGFDMYMSFVQLTVPFYHCLKVESLSQYPVFLFEGKTLSEERVSMNEKLLMKTSQNNSISSIFLIESISFQFWAIRMYIVVDGHEWKSTVQLAIFAHFFLAILGEIRANYELITSLFALDHRLSSQIWYGNSLYSKIHLYFTLFSYKSGSCQKKIEIFLKRELPYCKCTLIVFSSHCEKKWLKYCLKQLIL